MAQIELDCVYPDKKTTSSPVRWDAQLLWQIWKTSMKHFVAYTCKHRFWDSDCHKSSKKIQFLVQIIICGSSLPCASNFKIIKSMLTIFPTLLCWRQQHIMDEILKNALSSGKCLLIPGSKNTLSQFHKVVMLYKSMFKFNNAFRRVRVLKRLSWYTRLLEKLTELNRS